MMRVVILGAGYAGVAVARRLGKALGVSGAAHITLVNAHPHHVFVTELHKVAAGTARPEDVSIPVHRAVPEGVHVEIDVVTDIDPKKRLVMLESGRTLAYDRLVVALGSSPEFYNIPGLAEFSLGLSSLPTAVVINERIRDAVCMAEQAGRQAHVVIGGGGLTGVELAGELAHELMRGHRITLVELGPTLLPGQPERMAREAEHMLGQMGVTVRTGVGLKAVSSGRAVLTNDEIIAFDVLLWAGGVRGNWLVGRTFACDKRDRAYVDEYLRAVDYPDVYILGDAALAKVPGSGEPVPQTAQAALQQARVVAEHIVHSVKKSAGTVPAYDGKNKGVLVSIGPRQGLGRIGSICGAGRTWKRMKDVNDVKYRLQVGVPLFGRRSARWEANHAPSGRPGTVHRSHTTAARRHQARY